MKNIKNVIALIVALIAAVPNAFGMNTTNQTPISLDHLVVNVPMHLIKQVLLDWIDTADLVTLHQRTGLNKLKKYEYLWELYKEYTINPYNYEKINFGVFYTLITGNLRHLTIEIDMNIDMESDNFKGGGFFSQAFNKFLELLTYFESEQSMYQSSLETITIKKSGSSEVILSLQRAPVIIAGEETDEETREEKKFIRLTSNRVELKNIFQIIENCHFLEELNFNTTSSLNFPKVVFEDNDQILQKFKKINFGGGGVILKKSFAKVLKNCPMLERLSFNECQGIDEELANNLQVLKNLKEINLFSTVISSNTLAKVIHCCQNLQVLNVWQCKDAGAGIAKALADNPKALQNLKEINLSTTGITDDQLAKVINCCLNLEVLHVMNCKNAGAGIANALADNPKALQKLKKIDLSSSGIAGNQLANVIDRCLKLEVLDGWKCKNACAGIAEALDTNTKVLQNLKQIDLSVSDITPELFVRVINCCPNLEVIYIGRCNNAGACIDAALDANSKALKNLKKVDLSESGITDEQLAKVIRLCPNLEWFGLACCDNAINCIIKEVDADPGVLRKLRTIFLCGRYNIIITSEQLKWLRKKFCNEKIIEY